MCRRTFQWRPATFVRRPAHCTPTITTTGGTPEGWWPRFTFATAVHAPKPSSGLSSNRCLRMNAVPRSAYMTATDLQTMTSAKSCSGHHLPLPTSCVQKLFFLSCPRWSMEIWTVPRFNVLNCASVPHDRSQCNSSPDCVDCNHQYWSTTFRMDQLHLHSKHHEALLSTAAK